MNVEAPKTTLYWSDDVHTYAFDVAQYPFIILRDGLNWTTDADFTAHLVPKPAFLMVAGSIICRSVGYT